MLDFLGIGAQKAGTTWLYENLRHHPQIAFPGGKEIHYWDLAENDDGLPAYLSLFETPSDPQHPSQRRGEITPAYGFLPQERIKAIRAINPALRVFYLLRNPIERAWSGALMALHRAEMTIDEASDQWFIDHFQSKGSLARGDYATCIDNWLAVFPREQLLILPFERIGVDSAGLLQACCRHLGVEADFFAPDAGNIINQKVHAGLGHPIRPSLMPVLQALYQEKIERLSADHGVQFAA